MYGGDISLICLSSGNTEESLHRGLYKIISHVNSFHPTIKFTYDFFKHFVNFLDVEVIYASSCHVFHSKRALKNILGAIAIRLNFINSEPSFFDQRCNQLEKWLLDRGYRDKLVSGQIA